MASAITSEFRSSRSRGLLRRRSAALSIRSAHAGISGRLRFKVASLYRSPEIKDRLECDLSNRDGIFSVQANVLTGSLLVIFDREKPIGDVVRLIADCLETKRPTVAGKKEDDWSPSYVPTGQPLFAAGQAVYLTGGALHFNSLPAVILRDSPLVALPNTFVRTFAIGLFHTSPILILLISLIVLMGQIVGRKEGWSRLDALYFSLVTASTVGYGDFRPTRKSSKLLSIAIGLVGLLLTGMLTAIGVNSAQKAFQRIP